MRIALVVNRFPVMSETFIYNKVVGLEAAGCDVTVIRQSGSGDREFAISADGDAAAREVLDAPARSVRGLTAVATLGAAALRRGTNARPRARWRDAPAVIKSLPLRARRYDCIHFEFSGLAVDYLEILPLLSPTPVFVSCRGAAEQITPLVDIDRRNALERVLGLADRIHCVSADMLDTLKRYGLDETKAFVNRPAIDTAAFVRTNPPQRDTNRWILLSTGRLHWKKGHEHALVAVQRLLAEGRDVEYRIVGSGPHEECLRFTVDDLGIGSHVSFLGSLPSPLVKTQLDQADVFVLPSVSEGLSNAVLEAMAMELPVVTTTAGGMVEAVEHDVEGVLVPPRAPDALADAITALLGDPDRRARLGRAARGRVEREFDLARQIGVFVDEYTRAVSAARKVSAGR